MSHDNRIAASDDCIIRRRDRANDSKDNFMGKLGRLMDDVEFRSFFNVYFKEWDDIKPVLMIMKTYAYIDDQYYMEYGLRLDNSQIISIIKEMMKDPNYRKIMVESINVFVGDGKIINKPVHYTFEKAINQAFVQKMVDGVIVKQLK